MPKKYIFPFLFFLLFLAACSRSVTEPSQYARHVGDIAFDPKTDKPDFYLCNDADILQYHNTGNAMEYKGEKLALVQAFEAAYQPVAKSTENGLIRIRFVVNCKAETDRFRVMGMDENYQSKTFDSRITNQLLAITKQLNGWVPKTYKDKPVDYYQYLIFKIERGAIKEILP